MTHTLTKQELKQLIRLAKKALWSSPNTRQELQDNRVNITPANFYSDIPLLKDIENSFEYRSPKSEVYNSDVFDKEKIRNFIDELSIYSQELQAPLEGSRDNPNGFFWKNPAFSYSDAMAYYCVLRHFKPDHLLEVGSGFSTLIADQALKKNGHGKITLVEPYPKKFLKRLDTVHNVVESFAQDIPVNKFVDLVESSQVWFIDSTHTVKIGSDCLYLYLKVMPEVSEDIIVHSHDIYLPFGMPRNNAIEKHIYWTEQYLLYAYMLDNPKIEVLFGSAYSKEFLPESVDKLMAESFPGGGASLWYKLNGASGQ